MGSMEPIEELFARWYAPPVRSLAVAFAGIADLDDLAARLDELRADG